MRSYAVQSAGWCLWFAAAAGCGGAKPATHAAYPASGSPAAGDAASAPSAAGPPAPPAAQPTHEPRAAPAVPPGYGEREHAALREFQAAERELGIATGDCQSACRALASMDRATGRLCALTKGDAEPNRCDDAKVHLYSARDRVRRSCGRCEGGPSVDRSAPVPSL